MTIWEYHVEGLHGHHSIPAMTSLTDDLNRLGAEGWELVEGPKGGSPYHVFKRRKEVMPNTAAPRVPIDATPPVASGPQGVVSIMVDRVAGALRVACMKEFRNATTWSWDVSWRFAQTALEAIEEPTREILEAGVEIAKACGINISLNQMCLIWQEMLGRALK